MKAIGARQFLPVTDPDFLIEIETPIPEPGPLDLRIRIHACAVNPVDTKIRASLGNDPLELPRILSWDTSGTVESVGSEVSAFKPGDEVFCASDVCRPGSNAEFLAVGNLRIAHEAMENGRAHGKWVITVNHESENH